ncbi:MAG TPA: molybdopterin-dependent oxidoreductase [Dehalococcoidia bacterium]|nr:molybdopterin-dependent oxidoreductase [Dehalococcoidia bacterium]
MAGKDYEIRKTMCGMCSKACGIDVHLERSTLVDIRGMKEHPMSRGIICEKAKFARELEYSQDRLTTPPLRKNGGWVRISWDEALDILCEKLTALKASWGPEALAVYLGNSVGLRDAKHWATRFCDVYGTPNYSSVDMLCHWSRTMATVMTVGGFPVPDEINSKCIVVWGTNPRESNIVEYRDILSAQRRGAKLIVIDPRETSLARRADVYAQIRPGTDCALALGMIKVIIDEGLYDKGFVASWTVGFESLREHVGAYLPDRVSAITTVPTEVVYWAARTYAHNRPASLAQHIAIDHNTNGFQTIRALSILESITGNIDVVGGGKLVPGAGLSNMRLQEGIDPKTIGLEEYPLFVTFMKIAHGMDFARAIVTEKPYPIKAMILHGSNPILTWPDSETTTRALEKLDFLVVMDIFLTETARIAHLVLPACTFLERIELCDYGYFQGLPMLVLRNQIFEPLAQSYPDWRFWLELAKRMGYHEYFPWKDNEEMLDHLLKPTGISVAQLKANPAGVFYSQDRRQRFLQAGFNTPSGKIEIYSEALRRWGYDPLPQFVEPHESPVSDPALAKEYPLILITGTRVGSYWHSSFRNLAGPAIRYPEPLAEINMATARGLGIGDGDRVKVETPRGAIEIKARVTKYIHPSVVSIPIGWARANANMLTSYEGRDKITGYPAFKSSLCRVSKVSG